MAHIPYYRHAMKRLMRTIMESLHTGDLLPELYANSILLPEEYEMVDREGTYRGSTSQAKLLLDIMLKKETKYIESFVWVLQKSGEMEHSGHKIIADMIMDTAQKMWSGEIRTDFTTKS